MKEVFRDPDPAQVGIFSGVLESEGIPCFTKNQALGAEGGLLAECWPTLCVIDDEDYPEAMRVLTELQKPDDSPKRDWKCASCGETVPGNFTNCWNCQAQRGK